MENRSKNLKSCFKRKKKKKKANEWTTDKHITIERIYIFVKAHSYWYLILWNDSNKEAHCDQITTFPISTHHIPLIYILGQFVPLICTNTCYQPLLPPSPPQKIVINKKTGDLIGPWGKMWNTKKEKKKRKKKGKQGKMSWKESWTNNNNKVRDRLRIKLRRKMWLQTRKHFIQQGFFMFHTPTHNHSHNQPWS